MIKNLLNFFNSKREKFYKENFPKIYNNDEFEKKYQYFFSFRYIAQNRIAFGMNVYSKIHKLNFFHLKFLDFTLVQTPFYMLSLIKSFLSFKNFSTPIFRVNTINTSSRIVPVAIINTDYVRSFFNNDLIEFLSVYSFNDDSYSRIIPNVLIKDEWFENL